MVFFFFFFCPEDKRRDNRVAPVLYKRRLSLGQPLLSIPLDTTKHWIYNAYTNSHTKKLPVLVLCTRLALSHWNVLRTFLGRSSITCAFATHVPRKQYRWSFQTTLFNFVFVKECVCSQHIWYKTCSTTRLVREYANSTVVSTSSCPTSAVL